MKRVLISLLLIVSSIAVTSAQTTAGRLSGTISSPDGALPGATVTVTDNKTGKELSTVTRDNGDFLFQSLEFGTYTVKISNEGFKTYVANEVKIDVGREYTLSRTLEIGEISEMVIVTAGADVITATSAQVSNTVSPAQILSLPLVTRNPLSLTGLQAGVSSNSAQNTTINGMRTSLTNITRDGINIQDTFIRSNATDFAPGRPSVDDTGEFTIALANAEADQGYGGAQIRLVTPRGTKDFTGALFAYNRNSGFAANSFFNNRTPNNPDGSQNSIAKKPSNRNRNQYGGKLLGPLPLPGIGEGTPAFHKDKGFFFFAYEGIKDPVTTQNNLTRTILTPSAQGGAFNWARTNSTSVTPFCASQVIGSICTIPNILTHARTTLANGTTIPATISPLMQSRVLSLLPTVSNFTGGDGLNTAGYRTTRAANQERNQYSSRIDVEFNENSSLLGIFNFNKETNLRPDADTTSFGFTPGVSQSSANKQVTMAYRQRIGTNFVNELRGGRFTSAVPFDRTDPVPSFFLGLPLVTFPENTFMSQGRDTAGYNLQNNADWVLGKHTLRFGGQLQFFEVDAYNDAGINPTITVGTGTATPAFTAANFSTLGGISTTQLGTANGLMALLGGVFTTAAQSFNVLDKTSGYTAARPVEPMRYSNHSLYVSDRWTAAKGLTLSLGVRYELFPAMKLEGGLALEPVFADINDPVTSLLDRNGSTNFIGGNAGTPNLYYKTDYDNFAPNLGIAYSPSFESGIGKFLFGAPGKSVLRAGYSHIYGNDSIVTSIRNSANGNAGLARTTFSSINLNGRLDSGVPAVTPAAFTSPPRSYLLNNQQQNFFGTVFGIDPNIEIPKIEQYSVGFQREIFGNMALEIRYVGTRSNNLARGIDLNQIDIFNNGFLADFQRAQANLRLPGATTAFCNPATVTGCKALTIFQNGGASTAGRLLVGTTGGVSAAAFNNNLTNGTPSDLATSFVNNTANLNNHPTVANPTAIPRVALLPNPAAGAVDLHLNDGFYTYNSVQMELRRRFANGLYFQGNYTFSKNLTNAVGTSQALFEPYLDNNDKSLEKQRADFDQTHVFSFNGIYEIPFGKGKSFLNNGGIVDTIFGGWQVSSIVQWSSGAPISIVDTRGTLNRSGRSGRQTANSTLTAKELQALVGVFEANGKIYWINPSIIGASGAASNGYNSALFPGQVFTNVEAGQTGNLPRAFLDGPGNFNVNSALLKNFRFGERMKIQLRAEAFNLLNKVNFVQNTQFANINSTSFGQITNASSPREMQFAVRFEF